MGPKYQKAPIPKDEEKRLEAVYKLKILDTPPEERFDRITQTALNLFDVPISTITIVDSDREWFKSCQGLSKREGRRAISFCGHALVSDELLLIPDAKKDPRFAQNPMVLGKPNIRFYAGVPLKTVDGARIGAFCIKDTKPRYLSKRKIELLKALASWAELELNVRQIGKLLSIKREVEKRTAEINDILIIINQILRHDLLNNLAVIKGYVDLPNNQSKKTPLRNYAKAALFKSIDLINRTKEIEPAILGGTILKPVELTKVLNKVIKGFPALKFEVKGEGIVLADEMLSSLIENLIHNAQRHGKTDKVDFEITSGQRFVKMYVSDYGVGIPDHIKHKLFKQSAKFGRTGHTGLGLYLVKKTLERYGGKIWIKKNYPSGSTFVIRLPKVTNNG